MQDADAQLELGIVHHICWCPFSCGRARGYFISCPSTRGTVRARPPITRGKQARVSFVLLLRHRLCAGVKESGEAKAGQSSQDHHHLFAQPCRQGRVAPSASGSIAPNTWLHNPFRPQTHHFSISSGGSRKLHLPNMPGYNGILCVTGGAPGSTTSAEPLRAGLLCAAPELR